MEENSPVYQLIKGTPNVLSMIYQDCAQPSIKKIGTALETIFELGNTILLPLKLTNEKAKINFTKSLDIYKEKIDQIDNDKLISVPTILGIPIIDRLTYIDNSEIANLYINLLAKASSTETINEAHPTFIHIIDRMTVDEARIINHIKNLEYIPFINIVSRLKDNHSNYIKQAWNLTGLEKDLDLICPTNIDLYLDNLVSLQIIETQGISFKADEVVYQNLEKKYSEMIITYDEWNTKDQIYNPKCEIQKRFYEITELGKSFIKACQK
jgi:hypothetical protein